VTSIAFSPNGEIIAIASDDKIVTLLNLQGKIINTFPLNTLVTSIAFSPNGQVIAIASDDKTVNMWEFVDK
jgi:WD40 repeat protein